MGESLTGEQMQDMLQSFEHTAFRLETRDVYVEETEEAPFQQFLAGEADDYAWMAPWDRLVRDAAAAGRRFARVRVVSEPLSDYVRWSLHVARVNTAAGEDIRYLTRPRADELDLPDEDYWLFDSTHACVFRFGDDGRIIGRDHVTDAAAIVQRNHWRDAAWHHAVRWEEFAAAHGVQQ